MDIAYDNIRIRLIFITAIIDIYPKGCYFTTQKMKFSVLRIWSLTEEIHNEKLHFCVAFPSFFEQYALPIIGVFNSLGPLILKTLGC